MSLSKEALQHLEQSHKTGTEVASGQALVLGNDFSLHSLEKYQDERTRFRGKFTTEGLKDFTDYVSVRAEDGTPVFIDRDGMAARCYLDIGDAVSPGHCDHSATLTLPQDARISRLPIRQRQHFRSGGHRRADRGLGAPDDLQEQQE